MKKSKGYSKNIPQLPGVYKLTNEVNGKIYIGKSVRLRHRIQGHGCDQRFNYYIQRAIKKHGWANFKIEIIETYPSRTKFIEKYILEREMFWIGLFKSNKKEIGYNLANPIAGREGYSLSESHKEALRAAAKRRRESPEYIKKQNDKRLLREANKTRNKIKTSEYKRTLCGPKSSLWGRKHSAKTKEKMSRSSYKRGNCNGNKNDKKIDQLNIKTNKVIKTWDSLSEASKTLKMSMANISSCLNGTRKTAHGFRWKFHVKKLLICGFSGAGKSTLTKLLLEKYPDWDWVNGDLVRKTLKNYDFTENGRLKQADSLARYCHKSKKSLVICDAICPLKLCREKIGADAIIFINERTRCKFEDTLKMFEEPTPDECPYFFRVEGSVLEKLAEIERFIKDFLCSIGEIRPTSKNRE